MYRLLERKRRLWGSSNMFSYAVKRLLYKLTYLYKLSYINLLTYLLTVLANSPLSKSIRCTVLPISTETDFLVYMSGMPFE